jgi:4-amino-4-deoxy-L-arabinose transferase-like glycosyltransferase
MKPTPPASLAVVALVMALGVGVGFLGILRPVDPFDETLVLVGAERVVHGELPVRDFYTPYPPAQYLAVALLFKAFGVGALTLRVYCVVVRALVALLVYLLARRLAGRALAAACWCASILWLTGTRSFGCPTIPSVALVLLGLWVLSNAGVGPADHGRIELNQGEHVWTQADRALANATLDDLAELRASLGTAVPPFRRPQHPLWSCIYAPDLPWTP